jgi:hypothetical protein
MSLSRSFLGTYFFCEHCQRETKFMPIHFAIQAVGVSRTTMYYWMQRRLVHWLELPSGRPMICHQSLMLPTRKPSGVAYVPKGKSPKNTPTTA